MIISNPAAPLCLANPALWEFLREEETMSEISIVPGPAATGMDLNGRSGTTIAWGCRRSFGLEVPTEVRRVLRSTAVRTR